MMFLSKEVGQLNKPVIDCIFEGGVDSGVIRNYVASQGVVTISTRLWLQIQPVWCGDFESYHWFTLGRRRSNIYLCNLISSTHESRNGRRYNIFLFAEDWFISQRKGEREGGPKVIGTFSVKREIWFQEAHVWQV